MPAVGGGGDGPSPTEDDWPVEKDRAINLPHLVELSLTDLDPEYLCLLLDHLVLPAVTTLVLELLEQDYTSFAYKLAGVNNRVESTDGQATADAAADPDPALRENEGGEAENVGEVGKVEMTPYFGRLERLAVSAFECNLQGWRVLLRSLPSLRVLEIDFARVGTHFLEDLVASWIKDRGQGPVLLPRLEVFKASHLSGPALHALIISREHPGRSQLLTPVRWMVRWCERWRGCDPLLDSLIDHGVFYGRVRVEAWAGDEDEEDGEEGEEDGGDGDGDDGNDEPDDELEDDDEH